MKTSTHFPQRIMRSESRARMSLLTLILLIQIVLARAADAQQINPLTSKLESKLDRIATQDVPTRAPGIATGIVQNGKIIYSKCAGLEDLDSKSLITPKSRFNIVSTGKQFTALAIIQLEADGKLSFKDDSQDFGIDVSTGCRIEFSIYD